MLRTKAGVIVVLSIIAGFALLREWQRTRSPQAVRMTDEQMAHIVGGDGCRDCAFAGMRFDECAHDTCGASCSPYQCFSNYVIDSSCSLGNGTCKAKMNLGSVFAISYQRESQGCDTGNPDNEIVVATHYYSPNCGSETASSRCTMSVLCDGTLDCIGMTDSGVICF